MAPALEVVAVAPLLRMQAEAEAELPPTVAWPLVAPPSGTCV